MYKVLIADDNKQIVSILSEYCKKNNFTVSTVFDGEEALKEIEKNKFDIVLLDVMMPKKDGFDVCRETRKFSNVPIIMITARGEDYEKIMGLEIGADDYIVKPFSPGEIIARINAILRRIMPKNDENEKIKERKMNLVIFSGPPSSGKTSVILKTVDALKKQGMSVGVVKFDCLYTDDDKLYEKAGIPVKKGISGALCPDHFFVSNIEEVVQWGRSLGLSVLITESAGLCNRCSPYIKDIKGVCVIDNLSGINTPKKIGPMLKSADIVIITKGDIVSQAEREVFASRVNSVNPTAVTMHVNGLTGQGAYELSTLLYEKEKEIETVQGKKLRFPMPSALCSYCLGETRIGEKYQMGNVRKMNLGGANE